MDEKSLDSLSSEELTRIHHELLAAVERAKLAYERTKIESAKLKEIRKDLGSGHPDGIAATLKALRMESAANQRYADAIIKLSRFAIKRRVPSETR
jgi:hypothetical protein